ncbi:MAG: TetR/AcrR family transcriptional regulator [Rhodobacteraceae bacterium]|jgi:AcrR family transcriptional regulator|nr:TetR/AcrR family transcriptional regulator [Paracoccaceae bacterium]
MSDIAASDDEQKSRGRGPGRTTREDWLNAALDTLVFEGVDSVKVLTLAEKLDCARSSFYWYFKNRSELLDALLDHWQTTNTKALIDAANHPAATINEALVTLYISWLAEGGFDTHLDFAIRDWARRSGTVRRALDISDTARIDAITGMFRRFGYPEGEADVRGRIVYFTQIGYAALDQRESWEARIARSKDYLFCMTGRRPTEIEARSLVERTMALVVRPVRGA